MLRRKWITVAGATLASLGLAVPAASASASSEAPSTAATVKPHTHPAIHVSRGHRPAFGPAGNPIQYSSNWAGWAAVRKSAGQHFHAVTATFTVPSVNCNVTPGSGTYGAESAQWVGLDGWQSNSRTVEQTGVDSSCYGTSPSYFPWFEMYPALPVGSSLPVSPGDSITATVRLAGSAYKLTLTDNTLHQSQTITAHCASGQDCRNSSAEVISEAPYGNAVLPLADYGTAGFLGASITGPGNIVGGFSNPAWTNYQVDQVGKNGKNVISSPQGLYGGAAFYDQWKGEQ